MYLKHYFHVRAHEFDRNKYKQVKKYGCRLVGLYRTKRGHISKPMTEKDALGPRCPWGHLTVRFPVESRNVHTRLLSCYCTCIYFGLQGDFRIRTTLEAAPWIWPEKVIKATNPDDFRLSGLKYGSRRITCYLMIESGGCEILFIYEDYVMGLPSNWLHHVMVPPQYCEQEVELTTIQPMCPDNVSFYWVVRAWPENKGRKCIDISSYIMLVCWSHWKFGIWSPEIE